MQTIAFSDLRAHLADTLRQLQTSDQPICISQRGQPAAVLMSVAQYQGLSGPIPGPAAALEAWRAKYLQGDLLDQDDDPWADVRDRSAPGRAPVDFS